LDERGRFFFTPNSNGNRSINFGGRPREVAALKKNPHGDFWVHQASTIRFRFVGNELALWLDPTFVFTEDGRNLVGGKQGGRLAVQWGGKQRNDSALRNLIFWCQVLSKGATRIAIETGSEPIFVEPLPPQVNLAFGIEHDHVEMRSLLQQASKDLDEASEDLVRETISSEAESDG
jgi:hypothetical protein